MKILNVSTCSMIFVLLFFFSPTDVFSAGNLSAVKVAILYESIGDGMQEDLGRSKVGFYVDGALVNTTFDLPYQYLWNTEGVAQGDQKITMLFGQGLGMFFLFTKMHFFGWNKLY